MAFSDPTPNFGWALPDVSGDTDAWGTLLNEIFGGDSPVDGIDTVLNDVKTTADAALARAGGDMSGRVNVNVADWDLTDLGAAVSGTTDLDLDAANYFHGTVTGNTTFTFSNVPTSGRVQFFVVEVTDDGGGHSLTWPAAVQWPSGTAPTPSTGGTDIYVLVTRDGGTTVNAVRAMEDMS